MAKHRRLSSAVCARYPWATLSLFLLVLSSSVPARAQATAEYSTATSATTGVTAKKYSAEITIAPAAEAKEPAKFPHLAQHNGPPPEIENRRALEALAGKDAAKLLLRSQPSTAQVWIDGAFVGNTPLLLMLAPGRYKITMRGQRQESGEQILALLPNETQDIVLPLTLRYPTRVSLH